MIFKKKKTVLEEQPLCYWEESSYMMAVPKEGGMDLSDRKSTRLNSSHIEESRMPSSA